LILKFAVIAIAAGFFLFSFLQTKKERYRAAIWLLVAGAVLLRILAALDPYVHEWDERFHALVARNLIANPLKPVLYANPVLDYDYKNWMSNHVWLFKPPLALWLMALSLQVFGMHDFAVRIPSLILGSMSIYLTYRIGQKLYNEKIGLLAASLHAINGYLIDLSSGRTASDHVDTAFFFFIELGIFFAIRGPEARTTLATGIAAGLAVLTRYLPGLIVIPVWLALHWKRQPVRNLILKCLLILVIAAALFLPWELHTRAAYPLESQWVTQVNLSHLSESVDEHTGSFLFHFLRIPKYFGLFAYIGIGLYFWQGWREQRNSFYAITIWFLLPYLFFSSIATKLPGYVMMAAPALFLMISYACWYCVEQKSIVSRLVLVLLLAFPALYCLQRLKVLEGLEGRPMWAQKIDEIKSKFTSEEKVVLFGIKNPIETMFYTNFTAYDFLPTAEQERNLLQQGYTVAIVEGDTLAANRAHDEAEFVSQQASSESVSVTFKNTGATSWESDPKYGPFYYLIYSEGTKGAQCLPAPNEWNASRVLLTLRNPVRPGDSITFTVAINAPPQPGSYSMRWRLRKISYLGAPMGLGPPTDTLCVTVR
jgi:hypothetical protein